LINIHNPRSDRIDYTVVCSITHDCTGNTPFTRWSWLDELARRALDKLAWWVGYLVIWMV